MIFDLEQKISKNIDELSREKSIKDEIRQQIEQMSEEIENYKQEMDSLRRQLEQERESSQNFKESITIDIEQQKQMSSQALERERASWTAITTEKDNQIEMLRRHLDDSNQELARHKVEKDSFESNKREIMSEMDFQLSCAVR